MQTEGSGLLEQWGITGGVTSMTSLRPWLAAIMLVGLALLAAPVSAARSVPPNVGEYNYGFVRCDTYHWGYSSRDQVETVCANAYYNSDCGAQVITSGLMGNR